MIHRHNLSRGGKTFPALAVILTLAAAAAGCSGDSSAPASGNMPLITVGDSTLTLSDVTARIPQGLTPADSAAMFSAVVDKWLQDMLLRDIAAENAIDIDRIDRMTEEYRTRLIINEYIRRMQQSRGDRPTEEQIRRYYDANAPEMRLETPLIKGIFLKLPDDADRLDDVRRWLRSSSPSAVDNIEKSGLNRAMNYDYFMDRWIDWQDIAARIPYRFGDASAFVQQHKDFETTHDGSVYLLHISEVLPAGSIMPYDFAAPNIRDLLRQKSLAEYGDNLTATLAERARKEGRLSTPGYDIRTGKIIREKQR